MPGVKTYYPEFSNALYGLEQTMSDVRGKLKENAGFSSGDLAAFDTLLAQVQTATAYFPRHREQD